MATADEMAKNVEQVNPGHRKYFSSSMLIVTEINGKLCICFTNLAGESHSQKSVYSHK